MEERREQKTIEGFGRIFKPRYKRKSADGTRQVYESPNWWIAYYHNGEELRESSHSSEDKKAIKLLKRRVQDLGRGIVGTKEERVTFEQLVEDLRNDYKVNGKRSLDNVELSIRHCQNFSLEIRRAISLLTALDSTSQRGKASAPRMAA
jgi:hypothetical protein